MENVINISILADGISPNDIINAGVQGDDRTTVLKVSVNEAVLPTVSDGQTLHVFAEAVNGAGEYYVTEFLQMVNNIITFPLPLEITRGGGQTALHFVFVVLDANGGQLSAKYSSEIRLRFEDSAQFYQSEYLNTMASALAELYKYRTILIDYCDTTTIQEHLDKLDEQIAELETKYQDLVIELSGKVDKVAGMGLSKNDFNDDYKSTLDEYPDTIESILQKIDDTRCNISNLVNGSTAGSLRGINTKEEREEGDIFTPSYTMGQNAVAVGLNTTASGNYSHAEGNDTSASGMSSHAEGHNTSALGDYSHAEGIDTSAGEGSHAEGSSANASGDVSHAEGVLTTASGRVSHAEGSGTTASGDYSHAEGGSTTASGDYSHAEGEGTTASGNYSHAQGKFNIEDTNNRYAHIVGNGEDSENRSNAHTLDWDGNAWFAGDVYVGGTSQDDENATKLSTVAEKIKNHTSFLARKYTANTVYLKLGTFTGDNSGGRAIFKINGKKGWNYKNDGGLKVLTLSSNSASTSSTNIHTGATLYDFGGSNDTATSVTDSTQDIQVVLVRPSDYTIGEVDVYIKFSSYQYNSFFVTVDYSDGCSWNTDVQAITTTDTDPTTDALSSFVVPTKYIGDITKVNSALATKADTETGTCTLTVSGGSVSNATYSVVGNMVTLNFNIAPTSAGNVVVSGLPFTATKNQSGFASSTATYNITANQTSITINSTSGTTEYCTVTYLK